MTPLAIAGTWPAPRETRSALISVERATAAVPGDRETSFMKTRPSGISASTFAAVGESGWRWKLAATPEE